MHFCNVGTEETFISGGGGTSGSMPRRVESLTSVMRERMMTR